MSFNILEYLNATGHLVFMGDFFFISFFVYFLIFPVFV